MHALPIQHLPVTAIFLSAKRVKTGSICSHVTHTCNTAKSPIGGHNSSKDISNINSRDDSGNCSSSDNTNGNDNGDGN